MLDKLFGRRRQAPPEPVISFGRYSDNNKPVRQVTRWTDADTLFREGRLAESLDAFFDYIRDDAQQNVQYERTGDGGRFQVFQGSKVVRGHHDTKRLEAEVTLARMPRPSVPVMRRLLEMNFSLYYSRFALQEDRLCMRFDTDLATANPSKLYYGLKELATKADRQDDLLVQDFAVLEAADTDHVQELPPAEKEVKFRYLQDWIAQTLQLTGDLDPDKFAGAISHLLLSLAFRIDFLLVPVGRLQRDLDHLAELFFIKDERPLQEKNRDMAEVLRTWQSLAPAELYRCLQRARYTFAGVQPQPYKVVAEALYSAHQDAAWFRDNNYPEVARGLCEYGIAYCQYAYSLPRPVTDLLELLMRVCYSDFFADLGFAARYYEPATGAFAGEAIASRIRAIQETWQEKFPQFQFRVDNLRYDNLLHFIFSFTNELELLQLETA
ncbi:MAG TPA: hypothetical protein VG870_06545 [Chitinophagaceae bacterium]|nr:hypothetical protein [Chitinophagaceae bacterium]